MKMTKKTPEKEDFDNLSEVQILQLKKLKKDKGYCLLKRMVDSIVEDMEKTIVLQAKNKDPKITHYTIYEILGTYIEALVRPFEMVEEATEEKQDLQEAIKEVNEAENIA